MLSLGGIPQEQGTSERPGILPLHAIDTEKVASVDPWGW
jgi:hypothetical protein